MTKKKTKNEKYYGDPPVPISLKDLVEGFNNKTIQLDHKRR